ncbi:MAG: RNA-guided pseudouridylation complex pseudouridine synthase subunit Cbf5, partial [Candidatus Diapherotrites archaeon]|nr:RNA-guided pseudouridylation complex pseudouridine synthase subunit Cbf5 [Candidatus Diapherotrites archaeon]
IAHGAALAKPGVLEIDEGVRENELVAVMTKKGELVALATAMKPLEGPANKGFVAKPRQVVMDRSKYKKGWK